MPLRIEDYALIGNCKTAALVGRDGSIDWLCWPRFDLSACFAALLGTIENGRWLIAPKTAPFSIKRRYRPGTLILETEFETEAGCATIIDFMPPADGADLVRIVAGCSGRVVFQAELVLRFNYGASVPWVNRLDDDTINAIAGPERIVLRTPAALYGEDLKSIGEFAVEAGQSIPFVLSYGSSFQSPPPPIDPFQALERTETFWRPWSDCCPAVGPCTEAVKRSLITLKALTYAPTGGIVAAVTTSLPERLGGERIGGAGRDVVRHGPLPECGAQTGRRKVLGGRSGLGGRGPRVGPGRPGLGDHALGDVLGPMLGLAPTLAHREVLDLQARALEHGQARLVRVPLAFAQLDPPLARPRHEQLTQLGLAEVERARVVRELAQLDVEHQRKACMSALGTPARGAFTGRRRQGLTGSVHRPSCSRLSYSISPLLNRSSPPARA